MVIKKIEIRPKGTGDYGDTLYPKTSTDMVVDEATGQTVSTYMADNALSTRGYTDINDAITKIETTKISEPSIVGTYVGTMQELKFQSKKIIISAPIELAFYQRIKGNRVIIETAPGFVGDACFTCSVDGSGWLVDIENVTFNTNVPAIKLFSNNLDTGMINIKGCWFYGSDVALDVDCQSSILNIKECRFVHCEKIGLFRKIDQVNFSENFVLEKERTVNNSASFEIESLVRFVHIKNSMLVPAPLVGGVTGFAWFNFYGVKLTIEDNNFGGEPGNHTIVNWRSVPSSSAPKIGKGLIIKRNELWSYTGKAVRLYTVPDRLIIEENNGFSDLNNTMEWGGVATTIISASGGLLNQVVSVKKNIGTIPDVANYVLPELLSMVAERKLFNSRNSSLSPVSSGGNDITITAGVGRFNFNIGLTVANEEKQNRRLYNVEYTCQTHSGSAYYYGHYKGVLAVTTEFNGTAIVYKARLISIVNLAPLPESGGTFTPTVHFGNTDTGSDAISISGALDRTISIKTDKCFGYARYRVWETTDGTFII